MKWTVVQTLEALQEQIRVLLDRRINLRQNIQSHHIQASFPKANEEVVISHQLGVTPYTFISSVDKGGIIYESRRTEWTTTQVFLKSTVDNATAQITVFG